MGQGPVELRGRQAALPRLTDCAALEEPGNSVVDGCQLPEWLAPDREVYGTGSSRFVIRFFLSAGMVLAVAAISSPHLLSGALAVQGCVNFARG